MGRSRRSPALAARLRKRGFAVWQHEGGRRCSAVMAQEHQVIALGRNTEQSTSQDVMPTEPIRPTPALVASGLPALQGQAMADAPDVRDEAKRLIDQLPAGAGWDDVAYEVYVRQAIAEGLADAEAGRTVDHETALARVRSQPR